MLPIDHFINTATKSPRKIAVIGRGFSISYGELLAKTNALACALQNEDPKPSSRVGICGFNTFEHLLSWLATLAAGKVWIPLNPRNGNEELKRIIEAVNPSIIIADNDCLKKIESNNAKIIIGAELRTSKKDLLTTNFLIQKFLGKSPDRPHLTLDDVQAIKFTGGSSGTPKGCIQTYRVWNTCIASMIVAFEFNQNDRNLLAAPMTHGTNTLIMPIFSRGGSQAIMGAAKPLNIISAFEDLKPTTCFLPPTVIYMMMAEKKLKTSNLSSLKHLIIGGATMRPDEIRRGMNLFNNALETCYGQTEAPQIAMCIRSEEWLDEQNLESTGRATALTRVETIDTKGNILPRGVSGEIVLQGGLVMKEYFNMPEETKATIVNGWLRTGDLGIIDDRGYVFIKDRIRDVIITGGFNVYPSDIEAVLGQHPGIKECVVFGVGDKKWGEAVHAAVELHKNVADTEEDLIRFIKNKLDSVKAPKKIHITNSLPRSPVGKVLRREAKAYFSVLTTLTNKKI